MTYNIRTRGDSPLGDHDELTVKAERDKDGLDGDATDETARR